MLQYYFDKYYCTNYRLIIFRSVSHTYPVLAVDWPPICTVYHRHNIDQLWALFAMVHDSSCTLSDWA